MNRFFVLVLSLALSEPIFSQSSTPSQNHTRLKVDSLLLKSKSLLRQNPDSSKILAEIVLSLSNRLPDSVLISDALNIIGISFYNRGEYDTSLFYWNKALVTRERNKDQIKIAGSYNNIAVAYERKGNYFEAINYFKKALEIYKSKSDSLDIGTTYGNIAMVYKSMNELQKALFFHKKEFNYIHKNEEALSKHYLNVGLVYSATLDFDSARLFYIRALEIKQQLNETWGIGVVLSSIAENYDLQKNEDSAFFYYQKSKEIMQPLRASHLITMANIQLAKIYFNKNQNKEALRLLKESEPYLAQQETPSQLDAFLLLARINKSMGNLHNSIQFYELYLQKEDTLRQLDFEGKLEELKAKFYFEEKQKEAEYLLELKDTLYQNILKEEMAEKKYLTNIIILFALIFTLTLIFYLVVLRKNKKLLEQKKEIERLVAIQENEISIKSQQLQITNETIEKYAHHNAHELRGPLARILGIINLFEFDNIDKVDLWRRMKESANELDNVVHKISLDLEEKQKIENYDNPEKN